MSRRRRLKISRRRRLIVAVFCLILPIIWVIGLWIFANSIPQPQNSKLIARVSEVQADAIVVFTGGEKRLDTGFQLLRGNYSRKLFISGVYRGVEVASLIEHFNQESLKKLCCVTVGYNAVNTYGNVKESISWFKKEKIDSIIFVTSSYHVPRSLYYLTRSSYPLQITVYPVLSDYVSDNRWGKVPGTRRLIISEYNKYLLTVFANIFTNVNVDSAVENYSFTPLP